MNPRSWEVWDSEKTNYLIRKWGYPIKKFPRAHILMSKAAKLFVGDSVLDVGCGLGHLRHYLPENIEYMGIDNSEIMLKRAEELAPDLNFSYGDIYDLSDFGNYDTVYALSVLIHLPDLKEALEQLCENALKTVIFSMSILERDSIKIVDENTIRRIVSMKTMNRIFGKFGIGEDQIEIFGFKYPTLDYTKLFRLWMRGRESWA